MEVLVGAVPALLGDQEVVLWFTDNEAATIMAG
jgi:hypothetical protein